MEENNAVEVERVVNDTADIDNKYLTFWIDNQLFGVGIAQVVQIVGMQKITQIPDFPSYAKGIINLRGTIIPLIDIRLRFNKPEMDYNERTCIIVMSIDDTEIGFIVDQVEEVTNILEENISPPPSVSNDYCNTYLNGIAKHKNAVVLLINSDKIISDDMDSFTNVV